MLSFILLNHDVIVAIHEEQLAIHGGGIGLRDPGLLESALARPENKLAYEPDTDCPALAAAYGFGIARNHPFIDGNKRTALVAVELCLGMNGFVLLAGNAEAVIIILELASGEMNEQDFAEWIRTNIRAHSPSKTQP